MAPQNAQGGTDVVSAPPMADRPATARTGANPPKLRPRRKPAWVLRAEKATRLADVAIEIVRTAGGTVYDLAEMPEDQRAMLVKVAGVKPASDGSGAISEATWDTVLALVAGRLAVAEELPVCDRPLCIGYGRRHRDQRHINAGMVE